MNLASFHALHEWMPLLYSMLHVVLILLLAWLMLYFARRLIRLFRNYMHDCADAGLGHHQRYSPDVMRSVRVAGLQYGCNDDGVLDCALIRHQAPP